MDQHAAHGSIAVGLLTSPLWPELFHVFSTTMQALSFTTGAVIGCITLYRMWRSNRK